MKKLILACFAIALAASPLAVSAYAATDDQPERGGHHWMEERAALLDAHLAGFKAGLKLTPDQEKNWTPFEVAVRDAAKARAERFRAMRAQRDADERPSPIDRLRAASDRLAKGSADMKALADAAAPLYASLDDDQKRDFGVLFRDLVRHGRRHGRH
jgi:LTXXQ motif family protein